MALVVIALVFPTFSVSAGDGTRTNTPREISSTSWTQTSYDDFVLGNMYNTEVNGNGTVSLASIKTIPAIYYSENTTASAYIHGFLYGGLSDGTLFRINVSDGTFLHMGHPVPGSSNIPFLSIYNERVWGISNPGGIIFSLNGSDTECIARVGKNITSAEIYENEIWGAIEECEIFIFNITTKKFTFFASPSPSEKRITEMAVDPEGNIWLGTSPGGHVIKMSRFQTKDFGKISQNITEITSIVFYDDEIIIGGKGNDSNIYSFKRVNFSPLWKKNTIKSENGISDMIIIGNQIWGGSWGTGKLFRIELNLGDLKSWSLYSCQEIKEFTICDEYGIWAFASHGCAPVIINSSKSDMNYIKFIRKRSGKLFHDRFEGNTTLWREENIIGGVWALKKDMSRPNNESTVYSQIDASAASTFSIAGDYNWTDYIYKFMVKFESAGTTNPSGNGIRIPIRNNPNGDRFLINLYKTQNIVEIWKIGSKGTAKLFESPVFIDDNWNECKIKIESQRIHVYLNETRLTPSVGVSTDNVYPKGCIGLGTRYYSSSFDNITVYSSDYIRIENLPNGAKVTLYDENENKLSEGMVKFGVCTFSYTTYPVKGKFSIELKNETYESQIIDDIYGGDIYYFNLSSVKRVFFENGSYESVVYDAKYSAPWMKIEWDAYIPENTNIKFSGRASESLNDIYEKKWKNLGDGGTIGLKGRYFQYLVEMNSKKDDKSPILNEVRCIYDVLAPNISLISRVSQHYLLPRLNFTISLEINNSGDGISPYLHMYIENSKNIVIDDINFITGEGIINDTDIEIFNMTPHSLMILIINLSTTENIKNGELLNITIRGEFRDVGGKKYYLRHDLTFTGATPVIKVNKSCPKGYAISNGTVKYKIYVENSGYADAVDLKIIEEPSPGQKFLNSSSDEKRNGNIWTYPNLLCKENITLTTNFTVSPLPNGTILTNKVVVSYTDKLGNQYDNMSHTILVPVKIIFPPMPKMELKIFIPSKLHPGENFEIMIEYRNVGNAPCRNTTLNISLPYLSINKNIELSEINVEEKGNYTISASVPENAKNGDVMECFAVINGNFENKIYSWNASATSNILAPNITAYMSVPSEIHSMEKIRAYFIIANDGEISAKNITMSVSVNNATIIWSEVNISNGTSQLGELGRGIKCIAFDMHISGKEGDILQIMIKLRYMYGFVSKEMSLKEEKSILPERKKDTIPPIIIMTRPRSGGTNVNIDEYIYILFSEPMNETSVENAFSISPHVNGEFIWMGSLLVFKAKKLKYSTEYTIKIDANACDEYGNKMNSTYIFTFTTSEKKYDWSPVFISIIIVLLTVILIETAYIIKKIGDGKKDVAKMTDAEVAIDEDVKETEEEIDLEEISEDENLEWDDENAGTEEKNDMERENKDEVDVDKMINKMLGR